MNNIISSEKVRRRRQSEASKAKLAYSIAEFVSASGLGRTKTFGHIKSGALPAKKDGTRTIILGPAAEAFLEALPDVEPTEEAS